MTIATSDARAYWTPTAADLPRVPLVAEHYWDSVNDPQRAWAVAALLALAPIESVLDLGCQCGPTLRAIHAAMPDVQLTGLDINAPALALGREWLPEATFLEGAIPEALAAIPTASIDVVLSTYCLAYQDHQTVITAVAEALRIAKVGVVLIEPTEDAPLEVTVRQSEYVEWRHDVARIIDVILNDPSWPNPRHGLHLRWEPLPRHEDLTGVWIVRHVLAPEVPDGV